MTQVKSSPAACICTSGTAVCNYVPGITESFYQDAPVLAITADKSPYFQGQLETQKIDQTQVFNGVVHKSVDLPIINSSEDEWLCNRLVNEALLELRRHCSGPVHINIPIIGRTDLYDCKQLKQERKITLVNPNDKAMWSRIAEKLINKKILIVVGQNIVFSQGDIENLNRFFRKYNCIYAVEHLSNLNCDGCVWTYPVTEMRLNTSMQSLLPDIVISLGNNLSAYQLKTYLRANYLTIENWLVSEHGTVRDPYKCLTNVFECSVSQFFESILQVTSTNNNSHSYYGTWKSELAKIIISDFDFNNLYVAKKLAQIIPENSLLHLAILNSTRVMQYFPLAYGVRTFSNVGALGIDGCFSTFAGQAAATNCLAFLLIGDLSFFYDMNAAGLRSISSNIRVILLNNGGGSEFHFFMGKDHISTINSYICAEHKKTAKGWIESLGYRYYSASSKDEFDKVIPNFAMDSDKPIFLEVFTDMEEDAKKTKKMYADNSIKDHNKLSIAQKTLGRFLSEGQLQKAKKIYHILKGT